MSAPPVRILPLSMLENRQLGITNLNWANLIWQSPMGDVEYGGWEREMRDESDGGRTLRENRLCSSERVGRRTVDSGFLTIWCLKFFGGNWNFRISRKFSGASTIFYLTGEKCYYCNGRLYNANATTFSIPLELI